jgi:hypothetical protein
MVRERLRIVTMHPLAKPSSELVNDSPDHHILPSLQPSVVTPVTRTFSAHQH